MIEQSTIPTMIERPTTPTVWGDYECEICGRPTDNENCICDSCMAEQTKLAEVE